MKMVISDYRELIVPVKEYREFFLRSNSVNSGVKKDQEVGFPATHFINVNGVLKLVGNRFLDGHYPKGDVFSKLFESITFKLNPEDTATETEQGLVSIATHNEVIAGTNLDSNDFQLVVSPKDVPYIYPVESLPTSRGDFKLYDWFIVTNTRNPDYLKIGQITSISPFVITSFRLQPNTYTLNLTQSDTNNPVEYNTINNTIYPNISWVRIEQGIYRGTSTGIASGTTILTQGNAKVRQGESAGKPAIVYIDRVDDNTIDIYTYNALLNRLEDNILNEYSILIRS